MKNKTPLFLLILLFHLCIDTSFGQEMSKSQLINELSSKDQHKRDLAANKLRTSYKKTPRSKWEGLVGEIQKGQTKKQLFDIFKGHDLVEFFTIGSGRTHSINYELDNDWMLYCAFMNESDELLSYELVAKTRSVWVDKPNEKFTGKWITYFVNGQKAHEVNYKNGSYFGEFISYHSDGSKSYVQHYSESGANGSDTGYFTSGKISYKGMYENGKPCGTWIHFDESGVVSSSKNYKDCQGHTFDTYKINGQKVTKSEFEAKKKELKEISGTYHCAKTKGGGRNSYEAEDSKGVIWMVHSLQDNEYSTYGISKK